MIESGKDNRAKTTNELAPFDILRNFRDEIEAAMRTWSTSPWIPSMFDYNGVRIPLCEITDRGDRYDLYVELPGMAKENVKVKAKSNSVEISAAKSKETRQEKKGRIYTERSESSFYRLVPVPEEITPQKVKSSIKNGTLSVILPKKNPAKWRQVE